MTYAFVWNTIIENIVALAETGPLTGSGIHIMNATPDAADEIIPAMFPMDDPGVLVNSWQKITNTNQATKLFRSKMDYTINWIYLHVEIPQGITNFKKAPYRPVIREQISKIFTLISIHSTGLGVEYVKPLIGSFDFNLTSPATGRRYLGATFSINCIEYEDQTAA